MYITGKYLCQQILMAHGYESMPDFGFEEAARFRDFNDGVLEMKTTTKKINRA